MRLDVRRGLYAFGVTLLGCASLTGCNTIFGSDDARLTVLLTDAPSVMFESAIVNIGEVWLLPDGEEEERVLLTESGGEFDLLQLRNGVTATIADLGVPPGFYHQMRLIVNSATVTLANGMEFEDGTTEMALKVPSGAQSGIKINLRPNEGEGPLEITGATTLVVDFDVLRNFKIQGNPATSAGLKGVLFTPLLRAVVFAGAGSISGTVDIAMVGVPDVTVRAMLQDGTGEEATAVTAADGTYTIRFLLPGFYDVSVETDQGTAPAVTGVEVVSDTDTPVNFTLTPP